MTNTYYLSIENIACAPEMRHRLVLLDWVHRAEDMLWKQDAPVEVHPHGRQHLSLMLMNRLENIAVPALDSLLQKKLSADNPIASINLDLVPRTDRVSGAQELLQELQENARARLQGEMPVLISMLDRSVDQFVCMAQEMLARISENRRAISDCFFDGADMGALTGFSVEGADLHFNGKCTVIIDCAQGKFLYKPRDCRTDALYAELVARWFADVTAAPKCIVQPGYGFCEFISPESAHDAATVEKYFHNFGGLTALFQALGSSDLHVENFLMRREKPVLIDLETLFSPSPKVFSGRDVVPGNASDFIKALNESLYASSLFPKRMDNTEFSPLLNHTEVWRGLPMLNGKVQTVQDHLETFLAGFNAGYRKCMEIQCELAEFIEKFSCVHVRKLIRNTNDYARLLRGMHSPAALQSMDAQRKIAGKLRNAFEKLDAPHMLPLAEVEAEALLRGDVPYFYAEGDGCDLLADGKPACPAFFEKSGLENARRRIANMCEAELRFEMHMLRNVFENAVVPLEESAVLPQPDSGNVRMLSKPELRAAAEKVFHQMCSNAAPAPNGSINWMFNNETHHMAMRPELMMGTAGLGPYFAAYHAVMADERAKHMAEICLESMTAYIQGIEHAGQAQVNIIPPGLGGAAGILRALRIMEKCMGGCSEWIDRLLVQLERLDIEHAGADVFGGVSGLILELCSDEICKNVALVRRCVERLLESRTLQAKDGSMLWDTLGNGRTISGMGHGAAGIALALLKAYDCVGDARYLAAAQEVFAWEHGIYSEKLGSWPDLRAPGLQHAMHGYCSGAPGIGLALLACAEHRDALPHWADDLQRAIEACRKTNILERDHLCCGNSAAADFLLEAGMRLNRNELTESAYALLSHMARRKGGQYTYMPRTHRPAFSPSLFYGAAGVGYELLRAIKPDLPSLLI